MAVKASGRFVPPSAFAAGTGKAFTGAYAWNAPREAVGRERPLKRVIDEQDWTITKVTHFLNNSGFTTSLELEVRLSDVEYETEDDE